MFNADGEEAEMCGNDAVFRWKFWPKSMAKKKYGQKSPETSNI